MSAIYKVLSDDLHSIASEAAASYDARSPEHIDNLQSLLDDKLSISMIIKNGLPYRTFDKIQSSTLFTEKEWALLLGISTKSLQRYKQDGKTFKALQSEKIIEILEVCTLGQDIFGSVDTFYLWLKTPSFALGNHTPLHLLSDSYGKELVMAVLVRIDHGIFI